MIPMCDRIGRAFTEWRVRNPGPRSRAEAFRAGWRASFQPTKESSVMTEQPDFARLHDRIGTFEEYRNRRALADFVTINNSYRNHYGFVEGSARSWHSGWDAAERFFRMEFNSPEKVRAQHKATYEVIELYFCHLSKMLDFSDFERGWRSAERFHQVGSVIR